MTGNNQTRLELIANHTVEEAVLEELGKRKVGKYYTFVRTVEGAGTSGSRMGDGTWPEENFLMILYVPDAEVEGVVAAITEVKSLYPTEGIKLFASPARVLI